MSSQKHKRPPMLYNVTPHFKFLLKKSFLYELPNAAVMYIVKKMLVLLSAICAIKLHSLNYYPGLTKNASHTIFIYRKMLIIHFSCNSIGTENCMKGL